MKFPFEAFGCRYVSESAGGRRRAHLRRRAACVPSHVTAMLNSRRAERSGTEVHGSSRKINTEQQDLHLLGSVLASAPPAASVSAGRTAARSPQQMTRTEIVPNSGTHAQDKLMAGNFSHHMMNLISRSLLLPPVARRGAFESG